MQFRKQIGFLVLALVLATVLFSACKRGQGCPKFSVEISERI